MREEGEEEGKWSTERVRKGETEKDHMHLDMIWCR